jgi:protein-L-isoaspartate(D-aspartate) O-methyltransferase
MTEHNFDHMRRAMIANLLRTTGTNDAGVLAAFGEVPRERFLPQGRWALAYADALVPLTAGRSLNNPMSVGRLLTEASPQKGERALVVGAATGYSAALLSRLVGAVIAVEEDPELAAFAREALVGYEVELIEGPLVDGHAAAGPYDLILIDGAVEAVPDSLVRQLADEGRVATGIVDQGVTRLALGRRAGDGFGTASFTDFATAILPSFVRPKTFTF